MSGIDERTTGLIIRTRLLTDSSLIVHWLTPDFGRLATVAKGARRPKSPFLGKLDLFYRADLSFRRSRSSDLHLLREVSVRQFHPALRHELAYLRQAAYGAALIEQTTETEAPIPSLFRLLDGLLDFLPKQPPQRLTVFALEMKFLVESGLKPNLGDSSLSLGARRVLEAAANLDWPALSPLRLSPAQTGEIQDYLREFLIGHLERIPTGRDSALAP